MMHNRTRRYWRRGATPWALLLLLVALAGACGNRRPLSEAETSGPPQQDVSAAVTVPGGAASPTADGAGGTSMQNGSAPVGNAAAGAPKREQGGPAAAPATPAKYDTGASADKIVFGAVCSNSGPVELRMCRGTSAYFKYLNARGGINGRQIELKVYDDQWDPTRHAALVRQAFEDDKVFAFVNNFAPVSGQGGRAYVDQHAIPVIGGDVISLQTWGKSPNYYPQAMQSSTTLGQILGRYAIDSGCKKVAALTLSVPEAVSHAQSFKKGMQDRGVNDFVYYAELSFAEGQGDLTAHYARAKSAGADCINTSGSMDFQYTKRLDYHPRFFVPEPGYAAASLQYPTENENSVIAMVMPPPFEEGATHPGLKLAMDQINKFEPGLLSFKSGTAPTWTLSSWVSGVIAGEALKRMGNQLTRANLTKTLDSMRGFNSGIVAPVSFHPGPKNAPATCAYMVGIHGNRFRLDKESCL